MQRNAPYAMQTKNVATCLQLLMFQTDKMSITSAAPKMLTCSTYTDLFQFLVAVSIQVIEFSSRVKVSLIDI